MKSWLLVWTILCLDALLANAKARQTGDKTDLHSTVEGGLGNGFLLGRMGNEETHHLRQGTPFTRRTECTSGIPPILKNLGLSDVCADMDVAGCGDTISFGVRFASQRPGTTYLFKQDLDMSQDEVCGSSSNFTGTAVQVVCGSGAKLCFTFMRDGVDTLKIGPDFTSGCPSIKLEGCRPFSGPLPDFVFPLACFNDGSECAQYTSCDKCIEAGCGWCSAGYTSDHACMPGDKYKPVCDICGQGGGCDWNYGSCPIDQDQLVQQEKQLNDTKKQLVKVSKALGDLQYDVSTGMDVYVDGSEYECAPRGAASSAASAASAVTAFMSFLMLTIGCFSGCFLNKRGYMDRLPALASLSRIRDQPILSTRQGDAGASYVPPDL